MSIKELMIAFLSWIYQGDIENLGSKDYSTRDSAQRKLDKVGLPAYFAVVNGLKSSSYECRWRCERMLDSYNKYIEEIEVLWFFVVAPLDPDMTYWCNDDREFILAYYVTKHNLWGWYGDVYSWVRPPWVNKTKERELAVLIRRVQENISALMVKPDATNKR